MSQPDTRQPMEQLAPNIRPATTSDVPEIHRMLEVYASQGELLPRTTSDLYRHLRDFFVAELEGKIAVCGALEIFTENLGEVRSLVVAENFKGRGLGHLLAKRIVTEARIIGLSRLMALTYAPGFFHKLGFRTVLKDSLPEKVWGACVKCYKFNNCDETAVLLELQ